jgi:hypothetical protein
MGGGTCPFGALEKFLGNFFYTPTRRQIVTEKNQPRNIREQPG